MSFTLTTEQVRQKTKTVTRRLAWANLKVGTLLQPVVKCQGIPKGGSVEKIGGPIEVVNVRREPLINIEALVYGPVEVFREGFKGQTPEWFVDMFCKHNKCLPNTIVTRIEFRYVA